MDEEKFIITLKGKPRILGAHTDTSLQPGTLPFSPRPIVYNLKVIRFIYLRYFFIHLRVSCISDQLTHKINTQSQHIII